MKTVKTKDYPKIIFSCQLNVEDVLAQTWNRRYKYMFSVRSNYNGNGKNWSKSEWREREKLS